MSEDQQNNEGSPKLHIDSDWKAQAQQEKERLAKKEAEQKESTAGSPQPGQMPEADFKALVGLLAYQAMAGLGAFGDPKSGRVAIDPEGARFNIDLLQMLEEKTEGNLSEEESKELKEVVVELRSRFVQIMQMLAQQAANQPAGGEQPDGASGVQTPGPIQP